MQQVAGPGRQTSTSMPSSLPPSIGGRGLDWRVALWLGIGYPLLHLLGYVSKPTFAPAAIWPGHALTFGAFLLLPIRLWPLIALGVGAWELALLPLTNALIPGPPASVSGTLGFAFANVLTTAVPAGLARSLGLFRSGHRVQLARSPLWIVALFIGALPGALVGGWTRAYLNGGPFLLADVGLWALAAVLAVATLGPTVVGVLLGFSEPATAPARRWEGWAVSCIIVALFVGLAGAPWPLADDLVQPMLFGVPLVWLALRFPRKTTSLSVAVVALGVTFLSARAAGADPRLMNAAAWRDVMIAVDVFLLTGCGGALLINLMTLEQRGLLGELAREHASLQANESRLRAIVHAMPVLMKAHDEHGTIVAWNEECERVSGYTAAEVIGNPHATTLLYPDIEYRARMLDEAKRRRDDDYRSVWELTAKNGLVRTIEWFNVGARLRIPGWLEWSIGIDVTDRRRLEEALKEATLREQRRLGHELHDGLGQELTGLSMLASSLARASATTDAVLARDLAQVAAIASRTIVTCKNIARGLTPVAGGQDGLADALRSLVAGLEVQTRDVKVSYVHEGKADLRISLDASNHLFRIVQEALNNALTHAAARSVQVRLALHADQVSVAVSDDGKGLAPDTHLRRGVGLRTMRDRAAAIGARLTVTGRDIGGTVVRCECANAPPKTG